jgi:hypothetical protein
MRLQLHLNIIAGKDSFIWIWLSNSEENKWHHEIRPMVLRSEHQLHIEKTIHNWQSCSASIKMNQKSRHTLVQGHCCRLSGNQKGLKLHEYLLVSADSSQVLVVLETKKFILNFEPVSWFRHENCYVSFSVSL